MKTSNPNLARGKKLNTYPGTSTGSERPDPVGITATVPIEIIYAGGRRPVDLNNLFIASERPKELVAQAETVGFSHNICAWIKGIYSSVIENEIKEVVAVTGGDCSNTIALGELLERKGVKVIPFEYPAGRDRDRLFDQMEKLRKNFSTTWFRIKSMKLRLDRIRVKLQELDRLTFDDNLVSGSENHRFLVSSSNFAGDPAEYEKDLCQFLETAKKRAPRKDRVRLGYLGVPPIFNGFYEAVESLGARVVFNEVQRQFSMPFHREDILDQYLEYTYPYDIDGRLADIEQAVQERRLDGLIHYTQTFCYRQIYDMILRENLSVPILTLEGDRPGPIDARSLLRIETFVEMLSGPLSSSHP